MSRLSPSPDPNPGWHSDVFPSDDGSDAEDLARPPATVWAGPRPACETVHSSGLRCRHHLSLQPPPVMDAQTARILCCSQLRCLLRSDPEPAPCPGTLLSPPGRCGSLSARVTYEELTARALPPTSQRRWEDATGGPLIHRPQRMPHADCVTVMPCHGGDPKDSLARRHSWEHCRATARTRDDKLLLAEHKTQMRTAIWAGDAGSCSRRRGSQVTKNEQSVTRREARG